MKTEKNETTNQTNERLTDLPVTDDQAEQAKGGVDQVSINFGAIKVEYKPQRPD